MCVHETISILYLESIGEISHVVLERIGVSAESNQIISAS